MRKRWVSVLLALVMVLSVLPAAAFAEDDSSGAAYVEGEEPNAADTEGEDPGTVNPEDEDPGAVDPEARDLGTVDTEIEDPGAADTEGEDLNAAAEESGDFYVYDNVLQSYRGPGGEVVVPSGITSIGNGAFLKCKSLTGVTIPNSVTSIGNYAFKGCTGLTSVTIPDSVATMGPSVFEDCTGLTSVTISASVDSIQSHTFDGCANLTSVTIPGKVTSIGDYAFAACKKLASVEIPNGVISIGNYAFNSCSGLTSVTIPGSVTRIGINAFGNCEKLAGVVIPNSVTSIGTGAFSGCKGLTSLTISSGITVIEYKTFEACVNLTSVTIPYGVTSIGSCAFSSCTRLTSVKIPKSVTSIGDAAFIYCERLADVTIPDSVTSLGKEVFWDCKCLNSVTIPDGVPSIEGSTFGGCESLTSVKIPDSVTSIGARAFEGCVKLTSLAIPGKVTSIGANAFLHCSGLTSLTIPASVTGIGSGAFKGCASLKEITVEPGSQTYVSADGVLFDSARTTLVAFPGGKEGAYTVPDGVTSIGDSAFEGCVKLTSVTIPAGVTSIGGSAFRDCTGLTSVTIPVSVTSMGVSAFSGSTKLAEVYYGGTEAQWQSLCGNSSSFKGAVIHYGSTGPQDRQCPEEMTYSFGNYAGVFSYPEGLDAFVDQDNKTAYKIKYERYAAVYGNTPLADSLYSSADAWGGNCFGMSTTSALFFQDGNGVSAKDFKSTATKPVDLAVDDRNAAWDLTLRQFIEIMQVAQFHSRISSVRNENRDRMSAMCDAVRAFRETGMSPPLVSIYGTTTGKDGKPVQGGHAMLAYDLVEAEGGGYHLKVYDPNYPENDGRFITLDPSNGSWSYPIDNQRTWSNTDPYGWISFTPYSDFHAVWNGRPNAAAERTAASQADEDRQSALLFLNSDNAEIYDANGNKVAVIRDGQLQGSHRQDIFQMVPIDAAGTGTSAGNTALYLPPDLYTVKNTDIGNSAKTFQATMVHVDQSAAVSTSGSSVTFAVNDRTEVNYARVNDAASDPNTAYEITMKSTPAEANEALDTLTVTGQLGQGDPSIAQVSGELFAENLGSAQVQDGDKTVSQGQLKDGSTLDVSKIAGASGEITATLQAGGKTVQLSSQPGGSVKYVFAASYDSSGRMAKLTNGSLDGSRITFQDAVAKGSQIFLLNGDHTPVCGRITIK